MFPACIMFYYFWHKESQKLITHDAHCNSYEYHYTTLVSVVPICKDDLVCLENAYAKSLGLVNNILVCYRVTTHVHLVDPLTLQTIHLSSKDYYKKPFDAICSTHQLNKYTVIDVEPADHKNNSLADITILRQNFEHECPFVVRSHLGLKLRPGYCALGYDIKHANVNDSNFEKLNLDNLPNVILIKQSHSKNERRFARKWRLKRLRQNDDSSVMESQIDDK
ncbi:60S ribosomal export protein NMD3 [Thelohanellus kitauei]|uniref:60S ribosomal export protein NMD3 n=1 Tax=Thelohanellus kitauei TaxID=669202 RepID=A0A0C2IPF9_THEKT|nr:60S ribosomal export protein NMD3 [Thelohanellus kitauei]